MIGVLDLLNDLFYMDYLIDKDKNFSYVYHVWEPLKKPLYLLAVWHYLHNLQDHHIWNSVTRKMCSDSGTLPPMTILKL